MRSTQISPIGHQAHETGPLWHEKRTETSWDTRKKKESQGAIQTEREIDGPYVDIGTALMGSFAIDKYALLVLDGYVMGIIHDIDTGFYVFDSHSRNSVGMPDPCGTAVVMKCSDTIPFHTN